MLVIIVVAFIGTTKMILAAGTSYYHNPHTHKIKIPKSLSSALKSRLIRKAISHDNWVLATRRKHTLRIVALHWQQRKWMRNRLHKLSNIHWNYGVASFYSMYGATGGCGGKVTPYTFASYQVPCFAKVQFCLRGKCIIGTRTDSGPNGAYRSSRQFDLSGYMANYLGIDGVGTVRWRVVK